MTVNKTSNPTTPWLSEHLAIDESSSWRETALKCVLVGTSIFALGLLINTFAQGDMHTALIVSASVGGTAALGIFLRCLYEQYQVAKDQKIPPRHQQAELAFARICVLHETWQTTQLARSSSDMHSSTEYENDVEEILQNFGFEDEADLLANLPPGSQYANRSLPTSSSFNISSEE